jgi:hypothetical protein
MCKQGRGEERRGEERRGEDMLYLLGSTAVRRTKLQNRQTRIDATKVH